MKATDLLHAPADSALYGCHNTGRISQEIRPSIYCVNMKHGRNSLYVVLGIC